MFQRLKKVIKRDKAPATAVTRDEERAASPQTSMNDGASSHSRSESDSAEGGQVGGRWREGSSANGLLDDKPWKLERAAASRDYISGEEVRGRADIAVDAEVSIVIMNRPLKDLLEKRAYALYTDSLETKASPTLMEEMRWLALYSEAGWGSLADAFWHRYAVMTSHREHAMSWLTPKLASLLMTWPNPAPAADVPFILMVMRGKVHLRMQLPSADANSLSYISELFETAAQSAVDVFSTQRGGFPK